MSNPFQETFDKYWNQLEEGREKYYVVFTQDGNIFMTKGTWYYIGPFDTHAKAEKIYNKYKPKNKTATIRKSNQVEKWIKDFSNFKELKEDTGKYQVSYRQKQNGPYNKTFFDNEPAAKKFLADVEKKGGAGSIKTESVDEAFAITNKKTKKVLSTHKEKDDAVDELSGMSNKNDYEIVSTKDTGKKFSMKEDELDELSEAKIPQIGQKVKVGQYTGVVVGTSSNNAGHGHIPKGQVAVRLNKGVTIKEIDDLVIMESMVEATIKLPRAKNDQEVADRLAKLKKAGINAHSSAEAMTHINVDSKDIDKAKKVLGSIVEGWQGPQKDDTSQKWAVDNPVLLSKALSQGHKFVAVCGARKPQLIDWQLVSLNEFDRKFVRNVPTKTGEYIFRLIPQMARFGEMPLVKVNPKRGLIYFLTPRANEEDFAEFETKGTKLEYFRYVMESGIRESMSLGEDTLSGWIAIHKGKKLEIKLGKDADTLYAAKQFAIKTLKVPKSQQGLLAIQPAYECVEMVENISKQKPEPHRQAIMLYQVKHKVSWDKAKEAIYAPIKAAAKAAAKKARPPKAPKTPAEKVMTDAQFRKMMRGAMKDFLSDNPGSEYDDVAYDMADSMLYDPEVEKYVRRKIAKNTGRNPAQVSREKMKELVADNLVEDTDVDGEELNEGLRSVKITYSDGTVINTNMSAKMTDSDIRDYYKIGKTFNVGSGSKDKMLKVKKVDILEDVNEGIGNLTNVSDSVLKNMYKETKKSSDKEAKDVLAAIQTEMKKRGLKESEELEEAKSKEIGFHNKIKNGMSVKKKKGNEIGKVVNISSDGETALVMWKRGGSQTLHLSDLVKESEELEEISQDLKDRYKSKSKEVIKSLEPHAKKGEYRDIAKNLIAKRKEGLKKVNKPQQKKPFVNVESVELE